MIKNIFKTKVPEYPGHLYYETESFENFSKQAQIVIEDVFDTNVKALTQIAVGTKTTIKGRGDSVITVLSLPDKQSYLRRLFMFARLLKDKINGEPVFYYKRISTKGALFNEKLKNEIFSAMEHTKTGAFDRFGPPEYWKKLMREQKTND